MAGFSSFNDWLNEVTVNGKQFRADWNKNFLPTTPAVAGEWFCLARGGGNPTADALFNTGTNLTFQPITDQTANANSILHGGNVSPDYKMLTAASGFTAAATTAPAILCLVDLIGFVRVTTTTLNTLQAITHSLASFSTFTADAGTDICTHSNINLMPYTLCQLTTTGTLPAGLSTATNYYVINVTDTTIKFATSYANAVAGTAIDITTAGTGTHTINTYLPRYTNGAGVQSFIWANNATPLGAGTPTLTQTYTNAVGTTGRTTPTLPALPTGKTAAANGLIVYSGTGVGKYGPFMPLASRDTGIQRLEGIQQSATYTSGEYSIALAAPLCYLPITTLGVAAEREMFNQLPGPSRIYDGAALYWLVLNGAATPVNSAFYGHLQFSWG